jgi:hypothetical protein
VSALRPLCSDRESPRPVRNLTLRLASIEVPTALLAYHATRTVEIARDIRAGKEIAPLVVVKKNILVEGQDAMAALRLVGAETAAVRFVVDITLTWRQRRLLRGKLNECRS